MRMRFGVGMGRNLSISEVPRHVQAAEQFSFDQVSFIDTQSLARDTYVMMTLAAANSRRLRIGQGMTNPHTRHPAVTANATGTVHELSGGRAFLGLGTGLSSIGTLGEQPRPLKVLRDTALTIRSLASGEEVEFQGVKIRSEWMHDPFPIVLGSDGAQSLRLAAEIADGVDTPGIDPQLTAWRLEQIQAGADEADRDLDRDNFEIWIRTGCYIGDSKEEARDHLRSYVATYAWQFYLCHLRHDNAATRQLKSMLSDQLLEDMRRAGEGFEMYEHEKIGGRNEELATDRLVDFFMICGTPEQCREQLSALRDLGIQRVHWSVYPLRDKIGMMRTFSEKIMPYFR